MKACQKVGVADVRRLRETELTQKGREAERSRSGLLLGLSSARFVRNHALRGVGLALLPSITLVSGGGGDGVGIATRVKWAWRAQ
jgi:hypothetical protein